MGGGGVVVGGGGVGGGLGWVGVIIVYFLPLGGLLSQSGVTLL